MWWPRLEEEISKILKSGGAVVKKERRSERDILEELLQLSRLNTSRNLRAPSELAISDLVESLEELRYILRRENDAIAMRVLRRLEPPIRHLCIEAGIPFERYRLKLKRKPINNGAPASIEEVSTGASETKVD